MILFYHRRPFKAAYTKKFHADYFAHDARDTLSQMFNTAETLRELAYQYKEYTNITFNEDRFMQVVGRNGEYRHIFEKVYERIQELGLA